MSKVVKLKKGLNLSIEGEPSTTVVEVSSETYAIKPTDFIGFKKPKVLVKPGDKVKAGTQLYFDKDLPEVKYTSPVSGEVIEVKRGAQRRLLEIIVKADAENAYEEFKRLQLNGTRVIVKRIQPCRIVDEIDNHAVDIQLENLMLLCYALELAKLVMTLSHQMCTQCIFEGEDIDKHECFKFTLEEKLRRYLSLAWMDIDEDAVI